MYRNTRRPRRRTNHDLCNFTYVTVTVYFATFESLIVYRNTRRPCYCLKGLIAARFESSVLLYLLGLMGMSALSLHTLQKRDSYFNTKCG